MEKTEYLKLRERVRAICTKTDERRFNEYNTLMNRAEKECTLQQKGGLTKIIRERISEADYNDMYYSQF